MKTKLSEYDKAVVLEAFQENKGIQGLSEELGVQPGAIYRFLDENGYMQHMKRSVTKEEGKLIRKYHNEGVELQEMSKKLLIYPIVISMYMKEHHIRKKGSGRRATVITPEMKKEIVRLYKKEEKGCTKIAELMHTNVNTIKDVLRKAGIEPEFRGIKPRTFTEGELQQMKELYDEGWCTENIAKELQSNATRIALELKAMGYKLHCGRRIFNMERVTEEERKRIISLRETGHSLENISRWTDVPESAVKKILEEEGVVPGKKVTYEEMIANPNYWFMSFERFDELEFYKANGIDIRRKKPVEKREKCLEDCVENGRVSTVDVSEFSDLEV